MDPGFRQDDGEMVPSADANFRPPPIKSNCARRQRATNTAAAIEFDLIGGYIAMAISKETGGQGQKL
jgi:hypothetical protein